MRRVVLKKLKERLTKLDRIFNEYVEKIIKFYPHSTIILFGSRARRNGLPYSDFDIMVIIKDISNKSKINEVIKMYRIKPPELGVSLLLINEEELKDLIIQKMLKNGCEVMYDGLRIINKLPSTCKYRALNRKIKLNASNEI